MQYTKRRLSDSTAHGLTNSRREPGGEVAQVQGPGGSGGGAPATPNFRNLTISAAATSGFATLAATT
jgi:hypothetical protein